MNRLLAGLALAFSLLAAPPEAGAEIAFGARTQIWPFLFTGKPLTTSDEKTKLAVTLGNLDRYRELGLTWNIVEAWQGVDGPDGFRRLDRVFGEHEERGIQVALRVLETPEIYDDIRAGGDRKEAALGAYRGWVRQLASRYGARARYYMISNEADHDIGYNRPRYGAFRRVTADEYGELLRTAFEGIHAVDAKLRVADSGISSYSLALAVMADLTLAGRPGDALAFWRSMDYAVPSDGERTMARLVGRLADAESRRRIEFTRRTVTGLGAWRDVYQLHHYYGAAALKPVLEWLRTNIPRSQPIMAGEVGYLIPTKPGRSWDGRPVNVADMDRYSEVDHGLSLARNVAVLAGEGVEDILYWDLRFHVPIPTAASLYPPSPSRDAFRSGYPAEVFAQAVRELTGAVATRSFAPDLEGIMEYRFRRGEEFSIIWVPSGRDEALPADRRGRVSRVTDATGAVLPLMRLEAPIGPSPVYVHWRG